MEFVGPVDVISFGQTGVLIFFVHTTLVLMLSMERMSKTQSEVTIPFYIRRIFRIYPLSILAVTYAAIFSIPPNPIAHYQWIGWPALWSNIALVQNLTSSPNILGPLWSLPLECQMYLILPPLFFLTMRRRGWVLPLALWSVSVVLALLLMRWQASSVFQLGYFAPCFLGGLMAFGILRYPSLRLPFWGWPLVIISAFVMHQVGVRISWLGCLLLGVAAPQFRELKQPALRQAVAWIARYSYGLYLAHIIIFYYVAVSMHGYSMVVRILVCVMASILCPVILYHAVEKPMINAGISLANFVARGRGSRSSYVLSTVSPASSQTEYPTPPTP
jgi:peptidoglycan/LPS O-acetylase OafA/YrhL